MSRVAQPDPAVPSLVIVGVFSSPGLDSTHDKQRLQALVIDALKAAVDETICCKVFLVQSDVTLDCCGSCSMYLRTCKRIEQKSYFGKPSLFRVNTSRRVLSLRCNFMRALIFDGCLPGILYSHP